MTDCSRTPPGQPSRSRPSENLPPLSTAMASATSFDPFDALGLTCHARHTQAALRAAYLNASRLAHSDKRVAATASLFPSFVQVKAAYDYLTNSFPNGITSAATAWGTKHTTSWDPSTGTQETAWKPLRGINGPPAQIATPSSSRKRVRPRSSTDGGSLRTPTRPSTPGSSRENPVDLDSEGTEDNPLAFDDDDDGGDGDYLSSTPDAPHPGRRPRTRAYTRAAGNASPAASATTGVNSGRSNHESTDQMPQVNRSSGSSSRPGSIINPVVNVSITLGEWAKSTITPRHAVFGSFDALGRFNRWIVAEDVNGHPRPVTTVTACPHQDVVYRRPFQGMDNNAVRLEADRQLRLRPYQRP